MSGRASIDLRRAVLAFLLREPGAIADLEVTDRGAELPGGPLVAWSELAAAGDTPRSVARWLRLRYRIHHADADWTVLVRPVALPIGHALSPGPQWGVASILGGALTLGLGLRGFDDDGHLAPECVGLTPVPLLLAAGLPVNRLLDSAYRYLDRMAGLAGQRLLRSPSAPLRPVADCDVVTLLTARRFREALVADCPGVVGMRSAAVPSRRRGWLDLRRIDPAFASSAAMLTEPDQRAFARPILITVDEVVQVRAGGDPIRDALSVVLPADHGQPVSRIH